MKYLKLMSLFFLFFACDASARVQREDNCGIIADMSFIMMTQRQSGLSKEDIKQDILFEQLTRNEKKIVRDLIERIYKVPIKDEFNSYEYLDNFMENEREHCKKLLQMKI
ncbi:hypothetical protein WH285_08415 [Acinetobacter johnsonii]|uniref:hypothetical protein n=1 Tax=Acinetobacter johnsonii TaxID=40214 RepID=UPI0030A68F20